MSASSNNRIHHNKLINNYGDAFDDGINQWDNGVEGNYYSEYTGLDVDRDGIGDEPYPIPGGSSVDNYPTYIPLPNKPPVASFTYSPSNQLFINQEITFNASTSYDPYGPYDAGKIISYEWDFGDGETDSGEVVTHAYSTVGDYTVTLTVTDDDGATGSFSPFISVSGSALTEDIEFTVNRTLKCLDDIVAEANWSAKDGDYFAKELPKDQITAVVGFVLSIFGAIQDVPEDVYNNILKFSTPSTIIREHITYMEYEPISDYFLFTISMSEEAIYTTTDILKGTLKYFASETGKEAITEIVESEVTDNLVNALITDNALQKEFLPCLERSNIFLKNDLNNTESDVLNTLSSLSSEEVEIYKEDLCKRRLANTVLTHLLQREALSLHFAQDIREAEVEGWGDEIAEFTTKYGIKTIAYITLDGPGLILADIGAIVWESCQNTAKIIEDGKMMGLALSTLANSFQTSTQVYLNTLEGLEIIKNRGTPQIAYGEISLIENVERGALELWGMKKCFFVEKAYSNVTVTNTGSYDSLYFLSAEYDKTGLLGMRYVPLVSLAAKEIKTDETYIITTYYRQEGRGDVPDDNSNIQFRLLGKTDTGIYYADSASTVFGTQKIIDTGGALISKKGVEDAETLPYPVRSTVENSPYSIEYVLRIFVENPFNENISATLIQKVPATITATDTNNGTFEGNNISWHLDLTSKETRVIAVTFTCDEEPETVVDIPGAVFSIYDPINEDSIEFLTDPHSFKAKFPIVIKAYPPSKASIREVIVVPVNITNLLSNETLYGNIFLELLNSDGVIVYNLTEEISLAPEEIRETELIAAPDNIDPGIYVVRGTWQEGKANCSIFREFIFIDATSVFGAALLESQTNHSGSVVKLSNYATVTNPDGSYILTAVPVGTYSLTISHSGYLDYNEVVTVGERFSVIPQIILANITPPSSITNLTSTAGTTWINWTWTNPPDVDFDYTMVYINGVWQTNTSNNYYNATGLTPETSYEIGTHTVDTSGNINKTRVNQTAKTSENEPPVADAGPDQTVERSLFGSEGAEVTLDGSGSYDPDGDPLAYEWTWLSGSETGVSPAVVLPMGKTTVTLNVSDGMLYNTDTVNITVVDTTPPIITCPDDVTVEQETAAGTVVPLTATATDICDASPTLTNDAPAIFPLGTTTVTFTATDDSGNSASCTTTVTVVDTTPPVITCPADVTVEQETAAGTVVPLTATATDICDASPTITSDELAIYPLGTTTVTFTATDDSGNSASCSMTVTVVDTTPPVITCPADVTVEQATADGTVVPLTATATDICDADVDITSDAPAIFPLGTTTVTFTATDDAGNTASCTTTVTVIDTTPPDISVTVSPDTLWPPNHKMVDITATVTVSDICDATPSVVLTSVTSDEADNAKGNGDGNTVNDIQADIGTGDYEFQLRAERAGTGDGRVYTITYTVTDASGNSNSASATVVVPHDMG